MQSGDEVTGAVTIYVADAVPVTMHLCLPCPWMLLMDVKFCDVDLNGFTKVSLRSVVVLVS